MSSVVDPGSIGLPERAAAIKFWTRQALSKIDVPARQAFTAAVVTPVERTAAASLTTVARSIAVFPDREVDLGVVAEDERIAIQEEAGTRRLGAVKVKVDDPRIV